MKPLVPLFCFLAALLLTLPVAAQPVVEVLPPNPMVGDFVILRVTHGAIINDYDVTRSGDHFRIDVGICNMTCVEVGQARVRLGYLPAGSYTYEIHISELNEPPATGSFVVGRSAHMDAPALSPPAMITLSLILAAAGWMFLARGQG